MKLTLMAVAVLGLAFGAASVNAQPKSAYIETQYPCGMYAADGSTFLSEHPDNVLVITNGGTVTIKCYATTPNDTGKPVFFRFECGAAGFPNNKGDAFEVIDTEGNAVLTCHSKFY